MMREKNGAARRMTGTVKWTRSFGGRSEISYGLDLDARVLLLRYAVNAEPVREAVMLATTSPHYGGLRWWMYCPLCGRRVAVIYGRQGRFRCRVCWGLTYRSVAKHDARQDAMRRVIGRAQAGDQRALAEWRLGMNSGNVFTALRWYYALEKGPIRRRRS
jgi:hypothetical protein